jgi:NADPH2:quinone reductase
VQGNYPPPEGASDIPGLEVSGVVESCGSDVSGVSVGDRVCALLEGGGYAPYVCVPYTQLLPIPDNLSFEQAAALPEVCYTVWYNLFCLTDLKPNSCVLIHGGSSGIATMAIQLLKQFSHRVIVTTSSQQKAAALKALGADYVIDYKKEDFVGAVKDYTQGQGVDVVLDMVGGDYIQKNMKVLGFGGTLISIAFLQGATASLNMAPLLLKNLTLKGSTLRNQSKELKAVLTNQLREHVWPLLEVGSIKPVIYQVDDFLLANEVHQQMQENSHIGKFILAHS